MIDDVNQPVVVTTGTSRYLRDVAERVLVTFTLTFVGLMADELTKTTAVGHVMTVARGAAITSFITALVLLKTLLAKFVNNSDSASLAKGV